MKSFRTSIIIISTILSLLIISQGCKSNSTEPSDSDTTQFVIKPQYDIPWPTLGQTATQLNGGVLLKSCAIGLDGNIYTISSAGTLYAINQSGNIIWQRNAPVGYFIWGEMTTIVFPQMEVVFMLEEVLQNNLFMF